jgi:hypothetical protein
MGKFVANIPLSERIQKEQEFFDKHFLMSYSGLSKLAFSPAAFYKHYILGQKEDVYDKNMIEGSLIHCLLLNPEEFDNQFVVSVADLPSDNPRHVLHTVFNHYKELKKEGDTREDLTEFAGAILDVLKDINLYQSLKTDGQRIDKMINEKHTHYWEYLKKSEGRTVIDQDVYDFCKAVVEKIQSTSNVMDLMGFFADSFSPLTKHNEITLVNFDHSELFGIRGIIDNLVIDKANKVIKINDLKKTGKSISQFVDSIEYFKYWIQAAIYKKLIEANYLNQEEYKGYSIEFRFIVVDPFMQIAPIKVKPETLAKWEEDTDKLLNEAHYHFETRSFDLPYSFIVNNNELEI